MTDALSIIKLAREYVAQANQRAEAIHDNPGGDYMAGAQYEIMEETSALLGAMDAFISEGQSGSGTE